MLASSKQRRLNLLFNLAGIILGISYLALYIYDISPYWFNPQWVTDDALQQIYPFHKIKHPEVFKGDLITGVMEGYLAPLHYGISYLITYLTGDPIMMSHYVMLLQLIMTLVPFVLLVKHLTNWGVAGFALFWMVHTRTFMQRITGGIPRGWAPGLFCLFLYLLVKRKHKSILLLILAGCMLNPPATVIVGATYGFFLLINLIDAKGREVYLRPFIILAILTPFYALLTFKIVERPDSVGQMVTYDQAMEMPSMRRPNGRFPFAPLLDMPTELTKYAFQPLRHRLVYPDPFFKKQAKPVYLFFKYFGQLIFLSLIAVLLIICLLYRKAKVPKELSIYFLTTLFVYQASRLLAFKLYVPDRHLQQPLTVFWIVIVLYLVWLVVFKKAEDRSAVKSGHFVAFPLLLVLIYLTNGSGFFGTSNFNYSLYKKGKVFAWLRKNTPPTALIAGHPQHIDATMMFAVRRAYITYETSHPFYPKYFKEVLRRNRISLRAHYSMSLQEVYDILTPEGIDYFVFNKSRFYPDRLAKEKYFEPLHAEVRELASRKREGYAYKQIPRSVNLQETPYLLFRDEQSVVIDVKKLGEFLRQANV